MKTNSILIALTGILVGCGAGATVAATWAGPTIGEWQCYRNNLLPDFTNAAQSRGAVEFTKSLNTISPASPAGTVMQMSEYSGGVGDAQYTCTKN